MTWPGTVHERVQPGSNEDTALRAHLQALCAGQESPAPSALGSPGTRRLELLRGELLAGLGRELDGALTVLLLRRPGFALNRLGDADESAAIEVGVDGLAGLDAGGHLGGELVLVGSAGALWTAAQSLPELASGGRVVAAVVSELPVLEGALRVLDEAYGVGLGEALEDPQGGWLALAAEGGQPLVSLRGDQALQLRDGGALVQPGHVGAVHVREKELELWARAQATHAGRSGLMPSVRNVALHSVEGKSIANQELHHVFSSLPLFDYHHVLRDAGSKVLASPLPGVEVEEVLARIRGAYEGVLPGLVVELSPAGTAFPGSKVENQRSQTQPEVWAIWGGYAGTESRRSAWRAALTAARFNKPAPARVVDVGGSPDSAEGSTMVREILDAMGCIEDLEAIAPLRLVVVGLPEAGQVFEGEIGCYLHLLPGDEAREPMVLGSADLGDLARARSLFESGTRDEALESMLLYGINVQAWTRPAFVRGPLADVEAPLWVDDQRCVGSGDCVRICPTGAITLGESGGRPLPVIDTASCLRCQLCVERCEVEALRPVLDSDGSVGGKVFLREFDLLVNIRDRERPRALTGVLAEPPARLDDRKPKAPALISRKPTVVLGLAAVTLMEHAAALLVDGELVAAVEEERLVRDRHYAWRHPTRPGTSLASDPCLRVEEAWPPKSISWVLRSQGLTMDDVDIVGINGIPARLRYAMDGGVNWRPPPVLRANSMVYVPHHMSHAASVYGLSSFEDAWILSIDGRGDFETAAMWRAEGHDLELVDAVPWRPDRSFGGVYKTFTQFLGMGSHGEGSTMALAALGEPIVDVSDCMGLDAEGRPVLSEWTTQHRFGDNVRHRDAPLTSEHHNLAASVQQALERTVTGYVENHVGKSLAGQNFGTCGGVALNCKMNGVLRNHFQPRAMYVPPAANDAGTSIGAAVIAHRELTGEMPRMDMGHTHFGPGFSDETIARQLKRMGVPFQRLREVGKQTAQLLAGGQIVCWFQGPMEFGPRALGGRSILADPRREDLKERLNTMKGRQSWRPFGSSVLAGTQGDWFEEDWDSRFMLFAVTVRAEKRAQVPVIVHHDGTTRPQVVHHDEHPRYAALIEAFGRATKVPMIVNTSFNQGGEAIVCTPLEAMRSFMGLGADAIVLGNCLVRRAMLRR